MERNPFVVKPGEWWGALDWAWFWAQVCQAVLAQEWEATYQVEYPSERMRDWFPDFFGDS
jgi:hypothetical protein